jgi:hypothetical protein
MNEITDWVVTTINLPWFKFITFTLSLVSLFVSIWVFRKTKSVLDAQERSIRSSQIQYLNKQWQDINHFVLTHETYQLSLAKLLGLESIDEVQKRYFYYMFLNPLHFGYEACRFGLMDKRLFELDLLSVVRNFKGDREELMQIVRIGEYPDGFVAAFEKCLVIETPK